MKVGGALLGGYWPPEIPRRVAVPQLPLPALVRKTAQTARRRPALAAGERTLTYRELDELVRGVAASVRSLELRPPVVALAEEDGVDALVLLLAALDAGCRVAILDPGEPAGALAERLAGSGAGAVLTWSRPGRAAALPARLVRLAELPPVEPGPSPPARPAPPGEPAVMLPSRSGLADHSHFSLAAMATALTSFVPGLRSLDFLSPGSVLGWETLTGALGALLAGRAACFGRPDEGTVEPGEAYTVLRQRDADALVESGADPAGWGRLRYVFASIGPFSARWRRRLETALGRAVLPIWGSAEAGPAVAAHPTWYPLRAHGIPLVNVTLVPVDPATGRASEVPWAMLSQAQLGVDSPSITVADGEAEVEIAGGEAEGQARRVVRTDAIVEVDTVGVVRFLV